MRPLAHIGADYKRVQRDPSKPETLQIGKAAFRFVFGQTLDQQNLGPGLAAALDRDSRFRHAEGFGQEFDQRLIGLPLDRSGAHADLEDRPPLGVHIPAVDAADYSAFCAAFSTT